LSALKQLTVTECKVSKVISPITGPEGPGRFQEVKVPRFRDNRMEVGCQPYAPAAFTSRKYSW